MAILQVKKISGAVVNLKDPQKLSYDIYDIDSSETGRTQTGEVFRDRVAVKRKLTCSWGPLNASELSALLKATEDQFFTLTFPDGKTGSNSTMTCYVGDRSSPAYILAEGKWLWEGLSMNFIEK